MYEQRQEQSFPRPFGNVIFTVLAAATTTIVSGTQTLMNALYETAV